MTIKSRTTINKSPEKVWTFITTIANWEKWNAAVLKSVDPGWQKGATLLWESGEARLSDLTPQSYLEISSNVMKNVYRLTPTPDGKTLFELEMTPLGGAAFSDGGVAQTAKNDARLEKLKLALEST